MRTRGNQLLIQILLMIIITVIVAYTCMNLAELVEYVFRSDRKGNYSNQCGILIKV